MRSHPHTPLALLSVLPLSSLALIAPLAAAIAMAGCGPEGQTSGTQRTSPSSSTPTSFGDAGVSTVPNAGVDSEAVLSSIAAQAYQSAPFVEVTRAPYASAAVAGAMIREWVSSPALATYEGISPEVTGTNLVAPVGATIVRAVLAEDGGVAELTVMFKGPAGYNAALGDWWFAVTDPNGVPLQTDAGAELGKLTGCYSCHVPRANDGYLFGVPLDDRGSGVPTSGGTDDGGTTSTSDDAGSGTTTTTDAGTDAGDDAGADSGDDKDGGNHHHGGHLFVGE